MQDSHVPTITQLIEFGRQSILWNLIARGVVVNFDFREWFPRPRSQQRGSLRPRARRVAMRGGCRRGSPPPAEVSGGVTPGNFFWDFWCQIPRLGTIWARK